MYNVEREKRVRGGETEKGERGGGERGEICDQYREGEGERCMEQRREIKGERGERNM